MTPQQAQGCLRPSHSSSGGLEMAVSASRMSRAEERQAEQTWLATRSCREQEGTKDELEMGSKEQ